MKAVAVPVVLSVLSALSACPAEEDPCGEPAYGGAASDEAYRTMVDARDNVAEDETQAPAITIPEEGAVLPADGAAPTFAWTSNLAAGLFPAPRPPAAWRRQPPSILDRLSNALVPKAHAHLPPVTGDIYLVEIAVPERACPVAGLTTDLEWTLDEESWAVLKDAAGTDLSLTIVSAYLNENRVTEGPYGTPTPRVFRVE